MLQRLRILNFALIDELELSFQKGFSVITGETGSGKSILLGALNLILGERAEFSVIGPNGEKSIVEAEFFLENHRLKEVFENHDLDYECNTIVRREISKSGKSRAFINDTPVSLTILKEITEHLVQIHSQFNTIELKNKSYQLELLDVFGGLQSLRSEFSDLYKKTQSLYLEQKSLTSQLEKELSQRDYNAYQLQELEALQLNQIHYDVLETELKVAEHSGESLFVLDQIIGAIEQDDHIKDLLQSVRTQIQKITGFSSDYLELSERIQSVYIEVSEIANDALRLKESVEIDPHKLEDLTEKLNRYNSILNKHRLISQLDLIDLEKYLQNRMFETAKIEERLSTISLEIQELEIFIQNKAKILHEKRQKASKEIEKSIAVILKDLKLEHTRLEFELKTNDTCSLYGNTDATMLFSANLGMPCVPIEKAASGGELSRVMLALQKLISEKKSLPTILFDEIDTGVSGEVAQKIGELLQKMGSEVQLFAISHLAQVAAKASHHYKVKKSVANQRNITEVQQLNKNEAIDEIARLLSGTEITEFAVQTAKTLMN